MISQLLIEFILNETFRQVSSLPFISLLNLAQGEL